jgi:hypothetical protein
MRRAGRGISPVNERSKGPRHELAERDKGGDEGKAATPEPSRLRRLLRRFRAWLLQPVPFPRDHWYRPDPDPDGTMAEGQNGSCPRLPRRIGPPDDG